MSKQKNITEYKDEGLNFDISKTNDAKTNDFDLEKDKIPALSTIKEQIKKIQDFVQFSNNTPVRPPVFDRLKIGINLIEYGKYIEFVDMGLEDVENPECSPMYKKYLEKNTTYSSNSKIEKDENFIEQEDVSDFKFDFEQEEWDEELNINSKKINASEEKKDIFKDASIKRQVPYEKIKYILGLNNLYISKGYFVIDITGKIAAKRGYLGGLDKNNIISVIADILSLKIVFFDLYAFLEVAQVFLCDICLDIYLNSEKQAKRYISGVSSFFPLVSNRYKITKYRRHGLQMIPKANKSGISFSIYIKGEELNHSYRRRTRATIYTDTIGQEGEAIAKMNLRFEVKLYKLKIIREILGIEKREFGVVKLSDVLKSKEPVILKQVEMFSGKAEELLERLFWLEDNLTDKNNFSLREIFAAERFVEILKENNFDINIARSHIKIEYSEINDLELEQFNRLANLRLNILNFLVYKKPKSVTIMLSLLSMLQDYYYKGMVNANE